MKKIVLLLGFVGLVLIANSQNMPNIILKVKNEKLNENSGLVVNPILTLPTSYDSYDGKITLLVSGGTEPYVFNWGKGDVSNNELSGLQGNSEHEVYIKDAANKTLALYIQLPNQQTEILSETVIPSGYKKFYVSNDGNDINNGMSKDQAWKTMIQVQKKIDDGTIGEKCAILFKAGNVFTGSLNVNISAAEGSEFYIGAYGEGTKPIWDGTETLVYSGNEGNNVYRFNLGSAPRPRLIFVNGIRYDVSTLPEDGWFDIDGEVSDNLQKQFVCNELANISWDKIDNSSVWNYGYPWCINEEKVVSVSGTTLTTSKSKFAFEDNTYFKFLNDKDILTDYRYAVNNGYLYIKSPVDISDAIVKVCSGKYAINMNASDYINIDNIHFKMYTGGVYILEEQSTTVDNLNVENCIFNYLDQDGLRHTGALYGNLNNIKITGNNFNKIGGIAINLKGINIGKISDNTIKNAGWFFGSAESGQGHGIVTADGNNLNIEYNRLDSIKGVGIQVQAQNRNIDFDTIRFNYITNAALEYADIGAIYTVNNPGNMQSSQGGLIAGNIIDNVPIYTWTDPYAPDHKTAIYTDERSNGWTIENNTVMNSQGMGIYAHQAFNIKRVGNTLYNCGDAIAFHSWPNRDNSGNTVDANLIVSLSSEQYAIELGDDYLNDVPIFSNNTYVKFGDKKILKEWEAVPPWDKYYYTLQEMNDKYQNSTDKIFDTSELNKGDCIIKFNASKNTANITLPEGTFVDINGNSYTGSVKIESYCSIVLIKK